MKDLTSTSFAVLGLLAEGPRTTYELATQVGRGLRLVWPRAEGRIYDEPKLLVEHGLARAHQEYTGRRPRTVYSITPKGRRSLRRWVAAPGSGPMLEYEALMKIAYAARGSKADLTAQLTTIRGHAAAHLAIGLVRADEYAHRRVPLPENLAVNGLMWNFLWRFYSSIDEWATWALAEVARWPDDVSPSASANRRAVALFKLALESSRGL